MDILSARKKAAEKARAAKTGNPETVREAGAVPSVNLPEPVNVPEAEAASPSASSAIEAPAVLGNEGEEPGQTPAESSSSPETEEEAADAEEIEMLSFRIQEEEYAVMIDHVKEVLRTRALTPVPNAPEHILGVTALRGPILPVIDLCSRLGLPKATPDEKSRIVVVNVNDEEAGILVDRVTGVIRIAPDAVDPAPETIEHGAEYLRGIARKDNKLFILLDIEKAIGN